MAKEKKELELLPKGETIHLVFRHDEEDYKVTDLEKKATKKMLIDAFQGFPEDEDEFEADSMATKLKEETQQKMQQIDNDK